MTKSTITRERIQRIIRAIDSEAYDEEEIREWLSSDEIMELARMALAVMDSESGCLPLDYLQGHKDGLEWAAQLAEANHPETGDWLYDDPIELAKAIRKGPDMPPAQPAADSEPVVWMWHHFKQWHVTNDEERARDLAWDGVKVAPLYRHPQQPVVPGGWKMVPIDATREMIDAARRAEEDGYDAMHKAMLAAAPHDTPALNSVQSVDSVADRWIPVSEQMPEDRTQVILWDAEIGEVTSGHYSHKTHTFYHCGDAIENEITHWMPTPAAPQEMKGE